jgi:hypothetical protein
LSEEKNGEAQIDLTINAQFDSQINSKPNKQGSTWLVFDGLDTFATIEVCDQFVAYTDNQFRQWYFDITVILAKSCKGKAPKLSVNFGSATNITREIALHGDRMSMLVIFFSSKPVRMELKTSLPLYELQHC